MEVKVTILDDNTAGPGAFLAEHGLSVLLELDGRKFLWDCGQSDVAVRNARLLGIDLREIEGIGLSHGHIDHGGGLQPVLYASGRKPLYMHPDALCPRYFAAGEIKLFAGIPYSRAALETWSSGLNLSREPVEVLPGASLSGEIHRVTDFEGHEPNLFIEKDGEVLPDTFADDQSLVVSTPEGAVILTGCAHAGLVNICRHVLAGHPRIKAVIGGTHLGMGAPLDKVEATMDFLEEILPDRIIVTHCTGAVVMSRMMDRFKDRFVPGMTGLSIVV